VKYAVELVRVVGVPKIVEAVAVGFQKTGVAARKS
jgi:hypothetical protein